MLAALASKIRPSLGKQDWAPLACGGCSLLDATANTKHNFSHVQHHATCVAEDSARVRRCMCDWLVVPLEFPVPQTNEYDMLLAVAHTCSWIFRMTVRDILTDKSLPLKAFALRDEQSTCLTKCSHNVAVTQHSPCQRDLANNTAILDEKDMPLIPTLPGRPKNQRGHKNRSLACKKCTHNAKGSDLVCWWEPHLACKRSQAR